MSIVPPAKLIDTTRFSQVLRSKIINIEDEKLFITNFAKSTQETDLTVPPNCNGFGRIRHFRKLETTTWIPDNLPIEPARKKLGLGEQETLLAQLFQLGACNWRCWYCFVDFTLLSANKDYGDWLSTDDLVDFYNNETIKPLVIDLTGGQPDLAPEWLPWMMKSLKKSGLDQKTYLWSDDNLSSDYFWKYLTNDDYELITSYKNYGRVGCFKGFDETSFSFNTLASPDLFDQQFELMKKFILLSLDVYGYATFTTPDKARLKDKMKIFVDRLQGLSENFPLRVVPLEIKEYKANSARVAKVSSEVLENQYYALRNVSMI